MESPHPAECYVAFVAPLRLGEVAASFLVVWCGVSTYVSVLWPSLRPYRYTYAFASGCSSGMLSEGLAGDTMASQLRRACPGAAPALFRMLVTAAYQQAPTMLSVKPAQLGQENV